MNTPLVSVICLSYNHMPFVASAIQSVLDQTYPNIELIIVDDHSSDNSAEVIRKKTVNIPEVAILLLKENLGNCRAFNRGFEKSNGEFLIDLSADDVLMPDRIEKGIRAFQSAGEKTGVNFTDAELIDEKGSHLRYHSERFPHAMVPQGDIYEQVLSRYFINSPTMMIRRQVLEMLGGYDESLAYEDFDFWVRSSRYFHYAYTPEPLIKRRILNSSMGKIQYRHGSGQLKSTLKVCEKAVGLNRTEEEAQALKKRIRHEFKNTLVLGEMQLAWNYWKLYRKIR